MRYILSDLLNMRKDRIVNITVWDCFTGKVKIIQNRWYKWLVEIVDVSMCYRQQVQLQQGKQMWISKKDLFRDYNKGFNKIKRKCRVPSSKSYRYDDIPF